MILSYLVPADRGGRKVQSVLRNDMSLSAALVRRLKQVQGIFVNGEPVYTNYVLQGGETVTADISAAEPPCDLVPQNGDLEIIYENTGLLAVNKPSGMLTHPSRAQYTETLANYVSGYLLEKYGDGRCHAVNRLDRGTGGIVLFSKNSYMTERCAAALQAPDASKEYTAVVLGAFDEPEGTINLPIFRPDARDIKRVADERGQSAVTHYKTVAVGKIESTCVSVLSLVLETGRTHQIRVHCSHLGHPILGDRLYCSEESKALSDSLGLSSQALHAGKLSFTEPLSGDKLTLNAAILNEEMQSLLNSIK